MKLTQREAVFQAVLAVTMLAESDIIRQKVHLSKQQLEEVEELVILDFMSNNVELKDESKRTREYLNKYVPSLVNNWMRKDTRLTGGAEYVTKNPGIRAGSGDAQLTALKGLLAIHSGDSVKKAQIESAIEARKAELAAVKQPTINVNALPESLRHLAPAPKVVSAVPPTIRRAAPSEVES